MTSEQIQNIIRELEQKNAALQSANEELERKEQQNRRIIAEATGARMILENVLDSVSDGYAALDKNWNYTYVNEKGAALLNGHMPLQLIGKNIREIFPGTTGQPFYRVYQQVMEERVPASFHEYYAPWNMYFENRVYPSADGGITIFFTDVTVQHTASEKIRKSEEEMKLILDNTEERFMIVDKDFQIVTRNKAASKRAAELLGTELGEHSNIISLLDPVQVEDIKKLYRQVLSGEKTGQKYHVKDKDGDERVININYTPLFNKEKKVDQFMITSKDVTAEENIKLALCESEEKYKYLFYSNPLPYWIYDLASTRFLEVNDTAVKHYGYSREEFLAMSTLDIRPAEDRELFKKLVRDVDDGKLIHKGEWRHLKKNGELIYVEITSYRINYEGRTAALVLSNDITERKKAEDALRNSELRFRSLIEKGNEIIALHDAQGRIQYISPSVHAILGYEADERIGKHAFESVHPDDLETVKKEIAKLVAEPGGSARAQWRQRHADGSWHWMEGTATNLLHDPAVNAVVHNFRDISSQKEAESRLIREKELSESVINSLPGVFYLFDETGKFLRWNRNFEIVSGYSSSEISTMHPLNFFDEDEKPLIAERIGNVFKTGTADVEANFRTKDGKKIPYYFNGWAIEFEGRTCLIGMGIDIAKRKKAEDAIKASEEKRRLIMNAALDAIICIDTAGAITFWNPQAEKIFGWREDEVIGKVLSATIIPEPYRAMHDKGLKEYLKTGKGAVLNKLLELSAVNRDGKTFPVELTILPIRQAGEEFFCAFIRDISRRKAIEDSIRASKERYDIVTKATNDSIWDWDLLTNKVVRDNKKLETLFGYDGWEGTDVDYYWNRYAHPEDWARVTKRRNAILADPRENYWEDEYRFLRTNGEYAYIYDRGYILRDEENRPFRIIGASRDISERKLAEEKVTAERNLLRTLIDNMPDAIYVKDAEGRKLLSNKVDLEIMGVDSETEVIGKTDLDLYPGEVGETAYEVDMRVIKTGEPYVKREQQFITESGKQFWLLTTKVPLYNGEGEITGMVGIGTDIGNLKKIEAELLQSEEKYRLLFFLSPVPKIIFDIETGKVLDANNAAIGQYGYPRAELFEMAIQDIQPGIDIDIPYMVSLAKKNPLSNDILQMGIWDHVKKDGSQIKVEMSGHAIQYNGRAGMMIVCSDITAILAFQHALFESNERFEYATKATSDAIWDWNLVTDEFYWGGGFENLFGHRITEMPPSSRSWSDLIHPDDYEPVLQTIHDAIADQFTDKWSAEYRYRKADDEYAFIHDKGFIVRNDHGKGIRMIGAMEDITARKQGEEHLKLLESAITNTADSILITEAEPINEPGPRIIYVNDAFTRMSGYSREEVVGATPRILQGPKTDRKELDRLRLAMQKWEPCQIEVINYRKDGEEFWINMSLVPIANDKGWFTHWIAVERDVTERKMAENELKEKNSELKKLSAYLQNVREEERKYIAREVHDELGQLASALKIDIDWLNIKIASLEENAKNRLAHANRTIEVLISSIRKIASSLRPSILDDFGLNAALKWHCTEFQNLNGIQCIFEPGFDDAGLSMEMKTELYRMAQESLTNVMRHAGASFVTVSTSEDDDHFYLAVTDNGKGFDVTQRKNTLGLIGLRERALSLNGALYIESVIGSGTTISAVIPKN
jgi:PAS domain S-box-containing protein